MHLCALKNTTEVLVAGVCQTCSSIAAASQACDNLGGGRIGNAESRRAGTGND